MSLPSHLTFLSILLLLTSLTSTHAYSVSTIANHWWEKSTAVTLTDKDLNDMATSNKHYVIELYSEYCFWCEKAAPEFQKIVDYYMGPNASRHDIIVAKINAGVNTNAAYQFQVMQFPTIAVLSKNDPTKINHYRSITKKFEGMRDWVERVVGPENSSELYNLNSQDLGVKPELATDIIIQGNDIKTNNVENLKEAPVMMPPGNQLMAGNQNAIFGHLPY